MESKTEHASGFNSRETLYLNAFMLIYFLTFNTHKYAFPLFPFYSFDNDDMKSSKRHAVLLSLIFLMKILLNEQEVFSFMRGLARIR